MIFQINTTVTYKFLIEHGNYNIPVETHALRFNYKHFNNRFIVNKYNTKYFKKILYCFSVNFIDYPKIFNSFQKFCNSKIEVILKIHPCMTQNYLPF